jgi:hypothetical protein
MQMDMLPGALRSFPGLLQLLALFCSRDYASAPRFVLPDEPFFCQECAGHFALRVFAFFSNANSTWLWFSAVKAGFVMQSRS